MGGERRISGAPGLPWVKVLLIFLPLWALWLSFGMALERGTGFLTLEGLVISARALAITGPSAPDLGHINLTHPPMPLGVALPFAAMGFPHPSLWASSLGAAFLCGWFLVAFRRAISKQPWLLGAVLAVFGQPGVVHSALNGGAMVWTVALYALAFCFISRFALSQDGDADLKAAGGMTAWFEAGQAQNARARWLWQAALGFAAASLVRFDLLLSLPFLMLGALLLAPKGERDLGRMLTLLLVLFAPMIALHVMWGYLGWIFGDDFFQGFRHPEAYFRQFDPSVFGGASREVRSLREVVVPLLPGLAAGSVLLVYVLVRLRNVAVAFFAFAPLPAEAVGIWWFGETPSLSVAALPATMAAVLVLVGYETGRFGDREARGLSLGAVATLLAAWLCFVSSPQAEESRWRALLGGLEMTPSFPEERQIVERLKPSEKTRILVDQYPGAVIIALAGSTKGFVLPYQADYNLHMENPERLVTAVLARRNPEAFPLPDRVTQKWEFLNDDRRAPFRRVLEAGSWQVWERAEPLPH